MLNAKHAEQSKIIVKNKQEINIQLKMPQNKSFALFHLV